MENNLHKYFSRFECLKGRDIEFPLSVEQEENLKNLLIAVNPLREAWGSPMIISSLYRPSSINASVGGAKKSSHIMCLAVDFVDADGSIDKFCLDNLELLEELGLYLESPDYTPRWCHLQLKPTRNRVFKP